MTDTVINECMKQSRSVYIFITSQPGLFFGALAAIFSSEQPMDFPAASASLCCLPSHFPPFMLCQLSKNNSFGALNNLPLFTAGLAALCLHRDITAREQRCDPAGFLPSSLSRGSALPVLMPSVSLSLSPQVIKISDPAPNCL